MRILQLANAYGPRTGGIRTHIDRVREAYATRGVETVLVVPGPADSERCDACGRVFELASPRFFLNRDYRNLFRLRAIERLARMIEPDSIEIIDKYTLPWLARRLRRAGWPVVGFSSERFSEVLPPYIGGGRLALASIATYNRWFARQCDVVVSHSAYNAAELVAVGATNVRVVPLGVDLDAFAPRHRDESLRSKLLAGSEILLVYAGRLVTEKRVDLLPGLMHHLAAVAPGRYRLLVAGSGPLAEMLGAAPGVTMLGFVDRCRLPALIASADVMVHPSPIESFALGALEALASGCPVVGASSGGVPELVDARVGALALPTATAMARAVAAVAERRCVGLARQARHRAEAYPWSATADRLLAIHRELARP